MSGDNNADRDVFGHDLSAGATERVSIAFDDSEGDNFSVEPAISADGFDVSFYS